MDQMQIRSCSKPQSIDMLIRIQVSSEYEFNPVRHSVKSEIFFTVWYVPESNTVLYQCSHQHNNNLSLFFILYSTVMVTIFLLKDSQIYSYLDYLLYVISCSMCTLVDNISNN